MANIKGIELASEIYDLEDTSARDTATTASQTATQAGQTATQASQTATQAKEDAGDAKAQADAARDDIGDISALETSDTTDLVSAINEVNSKASRTHTQKTVSFGSDISVLAGERVDYIPGIKALLFYVDGVKGSALNPGDTLFTVNVAEPFDIGDYGAYQQITIRNTSTNQVGQAVVVIRKSGNTITAVLQDLLSSGSFEEFRMLQNVVFSL